MKQFLLSLVLFACLLIGLAFLAGLKTLPDEYIIYKTKGTSYEKVAWNLELVNQHPERIKNATLFFGPSLVQAGICDSTLNAAGMNAVNLATNGGGYEMQLYFLRRALPHGPAQVFLQVAKAPVKDHHNMTPLLYDPVTIMEQGQAVNVPFVQFLFKRAGYVLNYGFSKLIRDKKEYLVHSDFGVRYEEPGFDAERYEAISRQEMSDLFNSVGLPARNFVKPGEEGMKGFGFTLKRQRRKLIHGYDNLDLINNTASQSRFLQQAVSLSKSYATTRCLYVPIIADAKAEAGFSPAFYSAKVSCPVLSVADARLLDSAAYWGDMTHLDKRGAILFTGTLLREKGIAR